MREIPYEIETLADDIVSLLDDGCADVVTIDGEKFKVAYVGSVLYIDPCGKYHSVLTGAPQECIDFWDDLETAVEDRDAWIECGEDDLVDLFVWRSLE